MILNPHKELKKRYWICLIVFSIMLFWTLRPMIAQSGDVIDTSTLEIVTFPEFEQDIANNEIDRIYYSATVVDIFVQKTDGTIYKTINPETRKSRY